LTNILRTTNVFEKVYLHYYEINENNLNKYFFINNFDKMQTFTDRTNSFLKYFKNKYDDLAKNIEENYLYDIYCESLKENNFILLYELLFCFHILIQVNAYNLLNEFFERFGELEYQSYYQIHNLSNYNFFIIKLYCVFNYHYIKTSKKKNV
jgi:hypothetical protein